MMGKFVRLYPRKNLHKTEAVIEMRRYNVTHVKLELEGFLYVPNDFACEYMN